MISDSNVVVAVLRNGIDYLTKRAQACPPVFTNITGGFWVHPEHVF